jgi:hypothetical protein
VPAGVVAIDAIRRARPREKPRSARQVRHDERASLDALGALDLSTAAGRREAYTRLNALVRDHVHYAAGVEAASLTPEEIDVALAGRDERVPAELVSAVLAACDRARYAPSETLPSADECRATIERAAQAMAM